MFKISITLNAKGFLKRKEVKRGDKMNDLQTFFNTVIQVMTHDPSLPKDACLCSVSFFTLLENHIGQYFLCFNN